MFGFWKRRRNMAQEVAQVTESRRHIVSAFEIERRRIERDLHDGAQQYIVATGMALAQLELILADADLPPDLADLPGLVKQAQEVNQQGLQSLRETVNNIHPRVLADLGLEAAVRDVAARSSLQVEVRVPHPLPALPQGVVAAAYFMVAEALTNVSKYAPRASVSILLTVGDGLRVSVLDDGPGGAQVRPNGGLAGMRERLAAFGGSLTLSSPPGGPTVVQAEVPLLLRSGESGVVL